MTRIDRRLFLAGSALGAATLGLGGFPAALSARPERKTRRLIVVSFSGGIRTRETFGTPANIPNLMRLAGEGVTYPRTRVSNLGHFGATLSIFTGISEARGIRDNARGTDPTLFEYVRKGLGLSAGDVWISTSGGAQESNISYSLHPEFGQQYGASSVDGDGIFNAEFKGILDAYGRPRDLPPEEAALLQRMRGAIGQGKGHSAEEAESAARVERFLLDELKRGTQDLNGIGASDAKALKVARNLLAVFRPRFLTVVLRDADVAHSSFNNYVQVIRRSDQMLGELLDALRRDRELAETTSVLVVPEFGRDADLNSRRGLDHGDGSDDFKYVTMVCAGPDFRKGEVVNEEVRTIDLCTAACDLLGVEARYARGGRLPRLLA
jgi:hypothetical protein